MRASRWFRVQALAGAVIVGWLAWSASGTAQQTSAPAPASVAQEAGRRRGGAQAPSFTSPEVSANRRVTFRIYARDAQRVELRSPGDIPGVGGRGVAPPQVTKNADASGRRLSGPCRRACTGMSSS